MSLVAGHVGVHVAGVDVVHHDVLSLALGQLPLLDPAESAPAHLGGHVGGVEPAVSLVLPRLGQAHEVCHQTVQLLHGEILRGESLGELLSRGLVLWCRLVKREEMSLVSLNVQSQLTLLMRCPRNPTELETFTTLAPEFRMGKRISHARLLSQ